MDEIDIEQLVHDRSAFDAFVYTPLGEAMQELADREYDAALTARMKTLMPGPLPEVLEAGHAAVLFRQLATPNYETIKFLDLLATNNYLRPVFWEYYNDKFTPNNEYKRALGKMQFRAGMGKKGGIKMLQHTVIDFNDSNGARISDVVTRWGVPLVEFHHALFREVRLSTAAFFDSSEWFRHSGGNAGAYYEAFLRLFVQNGILFENFLIHGIEEEFTRAVFLPAFIKVFKETGHKPLIVPLSPTQTEEDAMWMHYPPEAEAYVRNCASGV